MADDCRETGLIGGVEKRRITIVESDPQWPAKFAQHAECVRQALGDVVCRVEHIGSTSVPGLAAKPIIDMLVVIGNSADESTYVPPLESVGYVLRVREPDWHQHRMFRTKQKDVHIHVYSVGCPEIERNLTFRDRLRTHAADRMRYEQTKRDLARRDWPDMNAYAQAKTDVIEDIIADAQSAGDVSGY